MALSGWVEFLLVSWEAVSGRPFCRPFASPEFARGVCEMTPFVLAAAAVLLASAVLLVIVVADRSDPLRGICEMYGPEEPAKRGGCNGRLDR